MKPVVEALVESATKIYGDGSGINADKLKSAIDAADAICKTASATSDQLLEQYDALNAAIDDYKMDNVSEDLPINCTNLITNPNFESGGLTGWTSENFVTQTNTNFTAKNGGTYIEKWTDRGKQVGNASVKQNVKLPNGVYRLTVGAQNLDQTATTKKCTGAFIYAGTEQTPVYTPANYVIKFTSITGEVEIGYKAENATGNWLAVDNFRLELIGKVDNAAIVAEIKKTIETAESLLPEMMNNTSRNALNAAIDAANKITESSSESDVQKAKKALDKAIEDANVSIAQYKELSDAIVETEKSYDSSKNGAADFLNALETAKTLAKNADATPADLKTGIKALANAELAFCLANAEPGSGTAPKVTLTNHHVLTGATEALMRATMTGSNIIERGICWSKEHNPTVLDERTTEYHSNNGYIYHARNLEPATVYYLRPYVMNKTYTVAYGDEVKIVTHPKGTCKGTWNEGAPDAAANTRCRNAINQTIEFFNQWTGIKGFTLTGNYGAGTPTADCSYGGWMRIGPNAGNQAIGTVIHETGHGVGVGTSSRWADKNVHNWKWFGREANRIYEFLENKPVDPYNSEFCMVGDGTHGWGSSASYDWFVNGADKDKHVEIQYVGGCCLLYGLFIDGLNPTTGYTNGIAGYTYNFDDAKKYYIMNKDASHGLGEGLLYQRSSTVVSWQPMLSNDEITDDAAWYLEYEPISGMYRFKNAESGKYLTHASGASTVAVKTVSNPAATENFQLMPDRTDVTIGKGKNTIKTHGYWFTWNASGNKAMSAGDAGKTTGYGACNVASFDYADTATRQQWIIFSEDELEAYHDAAVAVGIRTIQLDDKSSNGEKTVTGIYTIDGKKLQHTVSGFNIIQYSDGSTKKIHIK